ncbi:MAG: hypothetical protein DRI22_00445 [Caldiserica bacterium]|nr:MAG: hypothetical protein DRI22_00445 [Caldisericota bacterium]
MSKKGDPTNYLNFKVIRKFWGGERGFIDVEVESKRYRINVKKVKRGFLLGVNRSPTIPLSRINLLMRSFGIGKGRKKKELRELLETEIFALINAEKEISSIIYRGCFLNAKVYGYEDGTIRIYYKNKSKMYLCDVCDEGSLKEALYEICTFEGVEPQRSAEIINQFIEKFKKEYTPLQSVELPDGTIIRAVNTNHTPLNGDKLISLLWVWGRFKYEDIEVEGAKAVLVESEKDKVNFPETPIPDVVLGMKYDLVGNCILSVEEFHDLIESIKRGEIPTWNEIFNEIIEKMKEYVGIDEKGRIIIALFIIHTYFYELFPHTLYLIIVGESGSGKRNAKNFTAATTRSISVTSPTLPAMRRVIDKVRPVAVIDETKIDENLRRFLNAGNQKGHRIILCDKENPDRILDLNPYSPKVLVFQHSDLSILKEDTRNRCVQITMVRRKGVFKREVKREEVWNLVKKLYLLMLFRWKEYYDTYNKLDPIISKYIGGHARDKWLHLISLSYLIGKDVLEKVLSYCIEEYEKREEFSEIVRYTIYGILRALYLSLESSDEVLEKFDIGELLEEMKEGEDRKQIRLTPKAIVIANEGYYDKKNREHISLVRRIGKLLKRAELEFVVDFSREGKKRTRFYTIDLQKLYDYLRSYEPELPADINYKLIKDELDLDFENIQSKLSEFKSTVLELWERERKINEQNGEKTSETSATSAIEITREEEEKEEKESEKEEKTEKELEEIKEEFRKEEEAEKKLVADVSDVADVFPENHIYLLSIFGEDMAHKLSKILMELKEKEMSLEDLLFSILFNCGLDHIDRALEVVEKLKDEGIIEVEGDLHARDKTEVRVRYYG